ncbi:MAG TPA: 3,4-dihydroxy-2-butanone-4-phosphate synthase, partial [Candidatus Kapabacteria bacterium]|nr:3,4-dihydroxy-2-butanone-4-phosphate synthase [Candidatus Kapabacteria bacterium]
MLDKIEDAIADIAKGRAVIVVDDEERENEGDFIAAAEAMTPELVNFMVTHGRGMLCAPITEARAQELELDMMVGTNTSLHGTPFTVTIDYLHGTTTGISASDRSKTLIALAEDKTKPSDFARPGHIFPLRAVDEGVLRRAGHTEAAVDLARLAGLRPMGALCEIMNVDGTMARLPELRKLAEEFDMRIISVQDLIKYRMSRERIMERVVEVTLPTDYGDFQLHLYSNKVDNKEHIALVKGDIS